MLACAASTIMASYCVAPPASPVTATGAAVAVAAAVVAVGLSGSSGSRAACEPYAGEFPTAACSASANAAGSATCACRGSISAMRAWISEILESASA